MHRTLGPLMALALLSTACGGRATLVGRVVDPNGAPVHKAEVSTDPPTDTVVTNARGRFNISRVLDEDGGEREVPAGAYKVIIQKMGFDTVELQVTVHGKTELPDQTLGERKLKVKPTPPDPSKDPPHDHQHPSPPVDGDA